MEALSVNRPPRFRMVPRSTHDVVVVTAHGLRAAARARQAADDRDRVALEAELARDVLEVEPEEGQDRGARSRVRLSTSCQRMPVSLATAEQRRRTFSRLLQH